jgi:error-prone DNA polymerase
VRAELSGYESSLERREDGEPALRLGLHLVKSLSESGAKRLVAVREERPFESVQDLAQRAALDRDDLEALAAAGALACLSGNRHLAFWEVAGTERPAPLAPRSRRAGDADEGRPLLNTPSAWQTALADYRSTGLTLGPHPMSLIREQLDENVARSADLLRLPTGTQVKVAGVVLMRQHPASAKGVTFMTIEDETGHVNLIIWENVASTQRRPFLESRLLEVHGEFQNQEGVRHVIARRLIDRSSLIGDLLARSRDFH